MTEANEWADMRARYEKVVEGFRGTAHYPPVRVVTLDGYPLYECANGHQYGTGPGVDAECFRCRELHNHRVAGRPECIEDRCHNLVTCSDRAFEAGVRRCRMHHETMLANQHHAGPVCLDEFVTVMGQYSDQRWNGWLCPQLDAVAINRVIEAFAADEDTFRFEWLGDDDLSLKVIDTHLGEDEVYEEILTPDEDGLYALGSFGWTWSEDTGICGHLTGEGTGEPCVRYPDHDGDHDHITSSY